MSHRQNGIVPQTIQDVYKRQVQYIVASPAQSLIDTYLMRDGSKWDEAKSAYENRDPRMDMTIVRHGSIVQKRDGSSYTVNVNPNGASKENKDKIGHASGSQTGYFYRKYYDPVSYTHLYSHRIYLNHLLSQTT